jgi:hypothetical protein
MQWNPAVDQYLLLWCNDELKQTTDKQLIIAFVEREKAITREKFGA